MSIVSEPLINEREQEAKKLFGFAVAHDPEGLYDTIDRPISTKLSITAHHFICASYAETKGEESNAQDLLFPGINDVQTFILNIMEHHPDISFERAVTIAQHERTIKALAVIARQQQTVSVALLEHPGNTYNLSADTHAIEISSDITPNSRNGCPAIQVKDSEVEPWPIFNRFAPWAAKLALIAYYDHK